MGANLDSLIQEKNWSCSLVSTGSSGVITMSPDVEVRGFGGAGDSSNSRMMWYFLSVTGTTRMLRMGSGF